MRLAVWRFSRFSGAPVRILMRMFVLIPLMTKMEKDNGHIAPHAGVHHRTKKFFLPKVGLGNRAVLNIWNPTQESTFLQPDGLLGRTKIIYFLFGPAGY